MPIASPDGVGVSWLGLVEAAREGVGHGQPRAYFGANCKPDTLEVVVPALSLLVSR